MTGVADRLRQAGLKATAPRVALLRALAEDRTHPTVEQLHDRLRADHPSMSLSTVYLSIEAFLAAGLCRRVRTSEGRLRIDGRTAPHDHAVCTRCGAIHDVDRTLFPRPAAPSQLPDGLQVTDVHVEYEVTCGACAADTV